MGIPTEYSAENMRRRDLKLIEKLQTIKEDLYFPSSYTGKGFLKVDTTLMETLLNQSKHYVTSFSKEYWHLDAKEKNAVDGDAKFSDSAKVVSKRERGDGQRFLQIMNNLTFCWSSPVFVPDALPE